MFFHKKFTGNFLFHYYKVLHSFVKFWNYLGKFPDCYSCNCLSENRLEGRPRSHICEPIASVCHMRPCCEHAFFYTNAFWTSCFILSVMDGKIKQCVCIKFCVKLSKSTTETLEMLCEAFREHSLSRAAVYEWHSRFKAGWVSVEDDECSGRPSTSKTIENVEKIRELIHEDHRWTIHEVTNTVGISYGICQEILTENLNMRHIAAKFVPWLLTNDQKQWQVNLCPEL
jgi:transposase